MTVTINGTSGITTPGLNSTASNVLGDNVADTLNVGNGAIVTDSSGNVGIGTSSPLAKLHVGSGADTPIVAATAIYASSAGSTVITARDSTNDVESYIGSYSSGTWLGAASNHPAIFVTNNTERMRIASNGALLVGTTSGIANGLLCVKNAGAEACSFQGGSNGYIVTFHNTGGALIGSITGSNGSTTAYNTSSDYRLKENIQPMQNALAVVQQLNPVTYNWKADGSDGQGFIAHELQAVVPDCVTGEKDAVDEEGKPVYQGIDTSFLVATLTKAIQELKAELDATKTRLTAAEEQILNLGVTK